MCFSVFGCVYESVCVVHSEMGDWVCNVLDYSPRALSLAIWRLCSTRRLSDALNINALFTTVNQISVEDPLLDQKWPYVHVCCFAIDLAQLGLLCLKTKSFSFTLSSYFDAISTPRFMCILIECWA